MNCPVCPIMARLRISRRWNKNVQRIRTQPSRTVLHGSRRYDGTGRLRLWLSMRWTAGRSVVQWNARRKCWSSNNRMLGSQNRWFYMTKRANRTNHIRHYATAWFPAVSSGSTTRRVYKHTTKIYSSTENQKLDQLPASKWMASPHWWPAVTLIFDFWPPASNQVISMASEYSVKVSSRLLKLFTRYCVNKICPEEQTNWWKNEQMDKHGR